MHPTDHHDVPAGFTGQNAPKFSIIMPYLNEADIIVENTHEVIRIMKDLGLNYEVVLVDDGSTDDSFTRLTQAFSTADDVILSRNHQNFGKGWALKTGYEYSSGDYVLFLDSDLELSPYHLPNFIRVMTDTGADVVIGSKLHPDSILEYPFIRRVYSKTFYTIIKILFGLPITDTQTGIKLFKREALERSLPRLVIKKWAFDIELLLLLIKNGKKISSAPIELKFSRQKIGNIKLKAVIRMFMDTLAIFYRDKILRFYDRELGPNTHYRYSVILFSEDGSDYERNNLQHYLEIDYSDYEVILCGAHDFGIEHPRLTSIVTDRESFLDRLKLIAETHQLDTDYVVFSTLHSFPDKRFLFHVGRVLSLDGVGMAGGYVLLRNHPSRFEKMSNAVMKSVFLNVSLYYRYRAANSRKVDELQPDGIFIRRRYVDHLEFSRYEGHKLEFALADAVHRSDEKIIYTPDIMLYKKFPENMRELRAFIRNQTAFRAYQLRSGHFRSYRRMSGLAFIMSVALMILILGSITGFAVSLKVICLVPLIGYYGVMLLSSLFGQGLKRGWAYFGILAISQFVYVGHFLKAMFQRTKKTEV